VYKYRTSVEDAQPRNLSDVIRTPECIFGMDVTAHFTSFRYALHVQGAWSLTHTMLCVDWKLS
jgi:hypothetical protein